MKKKQSAKDWLDDLFDWEAKHPIAFASPRALVEARLIEAMEKARRPRQRTQRNGMASLPRRRKSAAA
jgi:hypothetical protein